MPNEPEATEVERAAPFVSLPSLSFEGPLDLLLQLIQKHELDILNLPISFVTEKYLEYLAMLQLIELDVAAEYLVMAATLAHIKSKMLLPAPPAGQEDDPLVEEEDPREALIRRLLEYQKYKHVAKELAEKGLASQNTFGRGVRIEEAVHTGLPPLAEVPLFRLLEAFQGVLDRTKVKITHDIVADRISITDRIHELAGMLRERKRIVFAELFEGLATRFDLVITFLALLEMTKLRMTRLTQTDPDSPIYVDVTAAFGESIDDDGNEMVDAAATAVAEDAPPATPEEPFEMASTAAAESEPGPDESEPGPDEAEEALASDDELARASDDELPLEESAPVSAYELPPEHERALESDQELPLERDPTTDEPEPEAPAPSSNSLPPEETS